MKIIIISISILLAGMSLHAQSNIDSVLASIEENNTTLKAFRETADAQQLENRTGIYLSDPEAGFNYLWGNPSGTGNRSDISVIQTFDIPTVTGMKSKVADGRNELVEWQYKADRMNILLEAKQYCIELIYYNALRRELDLRLQHAETIAAGYEDRLRSGSANRLEYNKAQLNLTMVQGEISRVEVERTAMLEQLKRLNAGNDIMFDAYTFEQVQLPLDFDDWYMSAEEKNPVLAYVKQEIEVGERQLTLSKAMRLPAFSVGYMSEKVVGQRYQGVSFGISIPLWENKNRVRQARAAVIAAESRQTDSKRQFYSVLRILYNRALGLQVTAETFRRSLSKANNSALLKQALDAGEISLLEYMVEIGLYYETVNQALEAERDYQKAFAELSAVEL